MNKKIDALVSFLKRGKISIATAESATCGMIAEILGGYPGISSVYKGGFVTYQTEMKTKLLGIPKKFIDTYGVVSHEVAYHMARKASILTGAQVGLSITGNAGPDALEGKDVGIFYIGINNFEETVCFEINLGSSGERNTNRQKIAIKALELLYDHLLK